MSLSAQAGAIQPEKVQSASRGGYADSCLTGTKEGRERKERKEKVCGLLNNGARHRDGGNTRHDVLAQRAVYASYLPVSLQGGSLGRASRT